MKNLLRSVAIFIIVFTCFSCTSDETPEQVMEGTWELVEIKGHWRPVISGENLSIKETYSFHHNGTFTKSRIGGELDHHASGTFNFSELEPTVEGNQSLWYIVDLTFNNNVSSDLVNGCNIIPEEFRDNVEELTEQLYLADDGFLRNGGCPLIADLSVYVYSKK